MRADGHPIPALLEAVLQLLPLDSYVYAPVSVVSVMTVMVVVVVMVAVLVATVEVQVMVMDLVNKDKNSGMEDPPVWAAYQALIDTSEGRKVSTVSRSGGSCLVPSASLVLV